MARCSVVQQWVTSECSWKEQTVLLCALRGVDAGGSFTLKAYTRWIRSVVLENAAPKKTFMRRDALLPISKIAESDPLALDMLPVHFLSHLMHALQVIGYRHPDKADPVDSPLPSTSTIGISAYYDLCDYLHLKPESAEEMTERLRDEV